MAGKPVFGLLSSKNVKFVEGDDFELLCRQLLKYEADRRHSGAEVAGKPAKYDVDGGIDLAIHVANEPKQTGQEFGAALTSDRVCTTGVSCKSGRHWRKSILDDAGRKAKKQAAVRIVKEGGDFLMMVHKELGDMAREKLLKEATAILADKTEVGVDDLAGRIHVKDANDIADFYAYHAIILDAALKQQLKIPDLQGFVTLEEWAQFLSERTLPDYSADDLRKDAIRQLGEVLGRGPDDDSPVVVWVYGPPGVGKSRLVLEAIRDNPAAASRALASTDFQYGRQGVHGAGTVDLARLHEVVLVVDECRSEDLIGLTGTFMAKAGGQTGTLVLIGPQDGVAPPSGFQGLALRLAPLEEGAARALVEQELGPAGTDAELVGRVQNLTEGFPWFVVLLAQALREDATALPPGSTHWRAAALAIAGPLSDFGNNQTAWEDEVLLRAKALLAVTLTEGDDWDRLTPEGEAALGSAFEADWAQSKNAAIRCNKRGLIRERRDWKYKYATPRNLARLAAEHLLSTPRSLGSKIRDNVPSLREYLYRQLEALEVQPALVETLTREELPPFRPALSWYDLSTLPVSTLALRQPAATASALRTLIEATSIDDLRSLTGPRREVMFALAHVCRRKEGFEDAEAALFRLAVAENESYGNNATGVWKMLFLGSISLTHRPFAARLNILKEHLMNPDSEFRLLAVEGLEAAAGLERIGPGFSDADKVDEPWLAEPGDEIARTRIRAWELLCEMTVDVVEAVAGKAELAVSNELRGVVRWGFGRDVIPLVLKVASGWPEGSKAKLRESIADLIEFDGALVEVDEDLRTKVEALRSAVGATDFHGRLLDVAGNWTPAGHIREAEEHGDMQEREAALDRETAQEGLQGDPPVLIDEMSWLESDAAVRVVPFMVQVGREDTESRLLPHLLGWIRQDRGVNVISAYLAGATDAGREGGVIAVLERISKDVALSRHVVATVRFLGLTDFTAGLLVEMIKGETVNLDDFLLLAYIKREAGAEASIDLIRAIAGTDNRAALLAGVGVAVGLPDEKVHEIQDEFGSLLVRASERSPSQMEIYTWEQGVRLALRTGGQESAVKACVGLIKASEHYGEDDRAWKILGEIADDDPVAVWAAIKGLLEEGGENAFMMALEARSKELFLKLPADLVLEWVGDDTKRSVWVATMCKAHSSELSEIARHLIVKFGPNSPAANELAARAHSSDGVVMGSLTVAIRQQLEYATNWAKDKDPRVAEWGTRLVEELTESVDAHEAWEEFEDKKYS